MMIANNIIRKISIKSFHLISLLFLVFSCNSEEYQPKHIFIKNVHVISMDSPEIIYNQNVLIENSVIKKIMPDSYFSVPPNTTIINGNNKYLIPGLSDMHMHIDHPDILKVNLAFGITSVMNYRGLPEHLELREKANTNQIFSPNIYTTGDYMEGYPATFPGFLSFNSPEEAKLSVRKQKELGYDFIKVYRNLDTLMHQAICEAAAENNMTVVGHLSPDISPEQSFKAGQKVVAHAEELMYFFNYENDERKIDDLISLMKKYQVIHTPNLTILKSLPLQVENLDSINSQKEIPYLHPTLFQSWRKENNYNNPRLQEWANFMKARFIFLQKVTKAIHDAGIPVLTSTDAPTAGAFPGLAVHQELEELVAIGLSPFEALKTATITSGQFIKQHLNDSILFGQIKEGYRADLLLLEKNPLEDISNTQSIRGVIKNGVWYSKENLVRELDSLKTKYKKISPFVLSIEKNINQGQIEKARQIYDEAKMKYPYEIFLGYYVMGYAGYRFLYQNRRLTTDPDRAKKAVQFYKMYSEDYPNMHGSYYLLGMAYKAQRDTTKAIQNFNKSLELHPFNPYARRRLDELGY